jgi:hypothetical protein
MNQKKRTQLRRRQAREPKIGSFLLIGGVIDWYLRSNKADKNPASWYAANDRRCLDGCVRYCEAYWLGLCPPRFPLPVLYDVFSD